MYVLAIGNSFSQDGMTYLHQAAQAQGEWIVCESLVFPGCSLSQHFDFTKTERKAYELFFNGEPVMHKISLKEALTDREWEAIQAGAISENKLIQIINNVDIDSLRERAMPRTTTTLSVAKQSKIAAMSASGYSTSEIAKALGVSTSTVHKYLS